MIDYPMQCLCIKCERPVDSGLFQLLRRGRSLCTICSASRDGVGTVSNEAPDQGEKKDFHDSIDGK